MAKFEKINGAFFNMDIMKNVKKTDFMKTYKDQRKHPFDSEDTWSKIQAELKAPENTEEVKK